MFLPSTKGQGLWSCPYQALRDPQHIPLLGLMLELLPLQEPCTSGKGFPGSLQSNRCWEMAPQKQTPGAATLAALNPRLPLRCQHTLASIMARSEIHTCATLEISSLLRKNKGSRPLRTFFFISPFCHHTTASITSLKRRMEDSRTSPDT